MSVRQYIVSVPVRCIQTYLVMAKNAAEAKRLVDAGEGDAFGWDTGSEGRAVRAEEAPAKDRKGITP